MNANLHLLVNQLLHDTSKVVVPFSKEIDEQIAISNEVLGIGLFYHLQSKRHFSDCVESQVDENEFDFAFFIFFFHVNNWCFSDKITFADSHQSRYCIPTINIAGSVGKETNIISSDVDLFIFIKNIQLEDYENVLEEFESLFRNWSRYDMKDLLWRNISVNFTVNNLEFDVVSVIDFVHEKNIGAEDINRNDIRYSPSLAFSVVNFVQKQPAAMRDVERLAKFWYKSACIEGHILGAMERIL